MFLKEFFQALHLQKVEYVVVGGLALVMHGIVRLTADIDLVVSLEKENLLRFLEVIETLGFRPRMPVNAKDVIDENTRKRWFREKGMKVLSFYKPEAPLAIVDMFIYEPIKVKQMLQRAELMEFEGVPIYVASVEDMIKLKEQSGRKQDEEDLKALRSLLDEKKGN